LSLKQLLGHKFFKNIKNDLLNIFIFFINRIYEETLNCLLYENRNGPDQELMQATSLRVPVASSYTSDDEEGDRQRAAAAAQVTHQSRYDKI